MPARLCVARVVGCLGLRPKAIHYSECSAQKLLVRFSYDTIVTFNIGTDSLITPSAIYLEHSKNAKQNGVIAIKNVLSIKDADAVVIVFYLTCPFLLYGSFSEGSILSFLEISPWL